MSLQCILLYLLCLITEKICILQTGNMEYLFKNCLVEKDTLWKLSFNFSFPPTWFTKIHWNAKHCSRSKTRNRDTSISICTSELPFTFTKTIKREKVQVKCHVVTFSCLLKSIVCLKQFNLHDQVVGNYFCTQSSQSI